MIKDKAQRGSRQNSAERKALCRFSGGGSFTGGV